MSIRVGRPRLIRPLLTIAMMPGVTACTFGEQAQAVQAQKSAEGGSPPAARPQEPDVPSADYARSLSAAFRSASSSALPSVVYVSVEREATVASSPGPELFRRFFGSPAPDQPLPPQVGSGSGFVIDDDGYLITNHHVIEGATRVEVRTRDGREYEAEVVGSDPSTDIALLHVDAEPDVLPPLRIGDSDGLLVGDWVLALGNPLGLEFTVTSGIVSATGRQLTTRALAVESYIQTDAAINPGNSGGPLIDLSGRVVGVNTAIFGGQRFVGYGFAVPIGLALDVVDDLREFGHARRPRLGVRVADVTAVDAEVYGLEEIRGAEVASIDDDSPARGRLEVGDVILELDGQPIDHSNALVAGLARRDPGDDVDLLVFRNGREREVTVTLGEFEQTESEVVPAPGGGDVDERLGFRVAPLTPEVASRFGHDRAGGLVISAVRRYGEAARAGVRTGQRLLAVNGERVETPSEFDRAIASVEDGAVVSLRVVDPDIGETIVNYRVRDR